MEDLAFAVRRFNRFYTRRIGILREKLLDSTFSLTEVRVLYEIAHRDSPSATDLVHELDLDPGYLSRILRKFHTAGLVQRTPSKTDGRQSLLALTEEGKKTFAELDESSTREVSAMMERLGPEDRKRLTGAMHEIEQILSDSRPASAPYLLRPPEAGDIGWVIQAHGRLYAREYNWTNEFEATVAEIAAKFIREFQPMKERGWIAERNGKNVGSVFLVHESDDQARLRLLLVEPEAQGLGIGRRLVEECIRFAVQCGYRRILLWTDSILLKARRIYHDAGFEVIQENRHHSFGHDLIGETWELRL